MPTDILIHTKGYLTFDCIIYKNVRNHSIEYKDNICVVKFNYTPKGGKRKGKDINYQYSIPLQSLYDIGVRTYE